MRDLAWLLAASLAAGLLISLLQGVPVRELSGALYALMMGLGPFLFAAVVTGAAVGLHRLVRRRPLPHLRLVLWSSWVLGNLLLLLDQHMAHHLG